MPARFFAAAALVSLLAAVNVAAQAPVRIEPVSTRTIVQRVIVPGTVTSPRTATLSTAVAGLVSELAVDAGRRVAAGEALLALDDELAALAYERLAAVVRQREIELADARRRLKEAEEVGPQRGIARTTIDSLRSEVAGDEAALLAARSATGEQRALVARHTVKAPFAGVISERHTELGEWVNPGDSLLDLVATDNLRFDFRIAQTYFGQITVDTPVTITLDASRQRELTGRIDAIVPVKNPGSRTFLVRVVADDADASTGITPGMSVGGRFSLDTGRRGVAVSRDAIVRFPDGRVTVWVVESMSESPVVREQIVRPGLEFADQVEVIEGLVDGDLVVVRGNESLQDGQNVTILGGGP